MGLHRWGKNQFLAYTKKRAIANGDEIFGDVALRLHDEQHPLLTRAVLVKRLVDVAQLLNDRQKLLTHLGAAPQEFYSHFIEALVEREIQEKWIDRSGEPHTSLLTQEEHYHLLSLLAQEMWTSSTDLLPEAMLDVVADVLCEHYGKSPPIVRQVKERLKGHALIVRSGIQIGVYSFDHEEFKAFFLGWGIAQAITKGSPSDLRRLLEPEVLSHHAADTATHFNKKFVPGVNQALAAIESACGREPPASMVRENAGALVIRLLDQRKGKFSLVKGLSFPADSLQGRNLENARFERCHFQPTSLEKSTLNTVALVNCVLERLDLRTDAKLREVSVEDTEIRCVGLADSDMFVYDPERIEPLLTQSGFSVVRIEAGASTPSRQRDLDEEMKAAQRLFRAFLRATELNENVLKMKAGSRAESVIDSLVRASILAPVEYRGSGKQRRFRLATRMRAIENGLRVCDGSFDDFIAKLRG